MVHTTFNFWQKPNFFLITDSLQQHKNISGHLKLHTRDKMTETISLLADNIPSLISKVSKNKSSNLTKAKASFRNEYKSQCKYTFNLMLYQIEDYMLLYFNVVAFRMHHCCHRGSTRHQPTVNMTSWASDWR